MTKKLKKTLLITIITLLLLIIMMSIIGKKYYDDIFLSNVNKNTFLYISTNAGYKNVVDSLKINDVLKDIKSFEWLAKYKAYNTNIRAGRYEIKKGMSNYELVNILHAGRQKPVRVTFNNIRTKEQFAGKISQKIEADSLSIIELLNNKTLVNETGFDKFTIISMFIPNTYEFYWNTSAGDFFKRMNKEYNKFWNKNRTEKAKKIGLSLIEISTLASIVQAEQSKHNEEKPIIAGLYLNRINRGMLLQSDPTLIFASGDFSIKRVLNRHKKINSPYNTYLNTGLPPGPINMPDISSIDAVLNYKKNNYIFMCAKEDFSGYHYFSKNSRQHEIYARKYRNALNKQKIWR